MTGCAAGCRFLGYAPLSDSTWISAFAVGGGRPAARERGRRLRPAPRARRRPRRPGPRRLGPRLARRLLRRVARVRGPAARRPGPSCTASPRRRGRAGVRRTLRAAARVAQVPVHRPRPARRPAARGLARPRGRASSSTGRPPGCSPARPASSTTASRTPTGDRSRPPTRPATRVSPPMTRPPTSPSGTPSSDGVATITLNRPDAMNSLDVATKVALRDAVQEAAGDDGGPLRGAHRHRPGVLRRAGPQGARHDPARTARRTRCSAPCRSTTTRSSRRWRRCRSRWSRRSTASRPARGRACAFACDFRVLADDRRLQPRLHRRRALLRHRVVLDAAAAGRPGQGDRAAVLPAHHPRRRGPRARAGHEVVPADGAGRPRSRRSPRGWPPARRSPSARSAARWPTPPATASRSRWPSRPR